MSESDSIQRPVKILYAVSNLGNCGSNHLIYDIIRYMDKEYFAPEILALSPASGESVENDFKSMGIPVSKLDISRFSSFAQSSGLKEFVERGQYTLLHNHSLRADMMSMSIAGNRTIVISTVHSCIADDHKMTYGRFRGLLATKMQVRALRRLDCVVAVSKTVAMHLSRFGIPSKTLQNGIDNDVFQPPSREEKLILRNKLGLPEKGWILISVGMLSKRKDPLTVISGFTNHPAREDEILIIIGDGPLTEECNKAAYKAENNILIAGRKNNIPDYLRAADIYISAALSEGLPSSVTEAMACGLPVVLSNIDPHKEILEVNPAAGIFFTAGNPDELTAILNNLRLKDTSKMQTAARAAIDQVFNARTMSARYQQLYKDLIEERFKYID